jgi:hypothetical protein
VSPAQDSTLASPPRGEPALPEPPAADDPDGLPLEEDERSLLDDVRALIEDGKTYLEAELAFQQTRAGYVADKAKSIAALGAAAVLLVLLALIGLTVGLIFALTPLLTAWGASAVVVGLLGLGAFLCVRAAAGHWKRLMGAMKSKPEDAP